MSINLRSMFIAGFPVAILSLQLALSASMMVPAAGKSCKQGTSRTGEVHLFRGTGGIFSGGMSTLAKKLCRRGVKSNVYSHLAWRRVSRNIINRSRKRRVNPPIIAMGHSAGGRAALKLARALGKNDLPVRYLVTFDPNTRDSVGPRIARVVNFYIPNTNNSNILLRGEGFSGSLQNIDVSNMRGLHHLNVEKNSKLQGRVVNMIVSLTRRK